MNELNKARGHIKVIFKMYCMEGASASKGVEGMGKNQFGIFCDETELDEDHLDRGGYGIPLATIDRIFIRSNYDRRDESDFKVETYGEPAGAAEQPEQGKNRRGREKPPHPKSASPPDSGRGSPTGSAGDGGGSPAQDEDTSQMNLLEFVAALVRLARQRYRDPSITERVSKLMNLISENPCFSGAALFRRHFLPCACCCVL